MELSHLIELIKELEPNQKFKYVRGDDYCTYLGVEESEPRVNSLTPLNEPHSISGTYLTKLAESIQPYKPFNISQLMNNSGSNRPVIESIMAHTSEFYWIQIDRAKYVVWIPIQKHNAGELVEWEDIDALKKMEISHSLNTTYSHNVPLQKIWFGTPGCGKSHKIKEGLKGVASENIFRITFHPDSDYSCFVGAYKPTMEKRVDKIYTIDELIDKLSEMKESGVTYSSQKFAFKYWRSLKQLNKAKKRVILQSCNMQDSLLTEFDKGIALGEEYLSNSIESRIVYSFVPQAFINAYIRAYQTSDRVYLIIEEINRGNCAQIFGDLFQLLDRGADGMSEYPIKADKDLCKYLESDEILGAGHPGIAGGNLQLPANLHIYATMNTSDQSLFPMDSAFKRRWDWEYVPIDLKCPESQFTITIGDIVYKWPSFLEKVNERIHTLSDSEDKQMGNFFIKQDVEVEEFKSKVMFYLWSEVCKEYEKSGSFFKNKRNADAEFTFNSLFPTNDVTNSILQGFMEYLGVEIVSAPQPSEQTVADSKSNQEAE